MPLTTKMVRCGVAALSTTAIVAGVGLSMPAQAAAPFADANLLLGNSTTVTKVLAADGTSSQVASGLNNSYGGVAFGVNGDIYSGNGSSVEEFPAGGGAGTTVAAGFTQVNGIAVDSAGNLYVADYGQGQIVKVPADGSPQVVLDSGHQFAGVTVSPDGQTVYAATTQEGSVVSVPATGGSETTVATNLGFTTGVAVATDGSVYATDYFGGTAYHVVNGVGSSIGTFGGPHSVQVDPAGNVYIAEGNNDDVVEVPADGSSNRVVASNTGGATGLGVQPVAVTQPTPATQPRPTQLPAKTFGFTAQHRSNHKIRVHATGLAAGEAYAITLGKRLVAQGHATATGQIDAKFKIPACTYKGERLLRITGSQNNRLGSKRIWIHKARSASCGSARLPY